MNPMRVNYPTMFFALVGWLACTQITIDFMRGFLRGLIG